MIIIYSPSIWHLYLSLIFICGLSKMNISSLKLWMYCSTAGISDLKTFVAVFASHLFFGVSWNCQGTFAGLLESSAWLQRAAGHIWGGFRASVSLDTTPEPFAFPLQQLWAVPLLSHLCFSLCCGFLPKCFLGCAFWVLCSLLFLLFFSACRVLLPGGCHRDHSTSLCLCERHCCPCVAWLAEPTASSQMCHLSLPHTV